MSQHISPSPMCFCSPGLGIGGEAELDSFTPGITRLFRLDVPMAVPGMTEKKHRCLPQESSVPAPPSFREGGESGLVPWSYVNVLLSGINLVTCI